MSNLDETDREILGAVFELERETGKKPVTPERIYARINAKRTGLPEQIFIYQYRRARERGEVDD